MLAVVATSAACSAAPEGPPSAEVASSVPDDGAPTSELLSPAPTTSVAPVSPQEVILTLDDLGDGWVEVDDAHADDPTLEDAISEACGSDIEEIRATLTAPGHAFAAFERPDRGWTIEAHVVSGDYDESLTAYHRALGACDRVETDDGIVQAFRATGSDDPGEDPYVGAVVEVYVPYGGSEPPQNFSPNGRLAGSGADVLMHAGCCWIRILYGSFAAEGEVPTTFRWFPVLSDMAERAHGTD